VWWLKRRRQARRRLQTEAGGITEGVIVFVAVLRSEKETRDSSERSNEDRGIDTRRNS